MTDQQPRAWLCKHCGERVDPTSELCWNCGYDRAGHYDPTSYREVGYGAMETCPDCGYSLLGSTDNTECPECGSALPAPGFKHVDTHDGQRSILMSALRGPIGWVLAALLALWVLLEAI